ncbi:DUF3592 domain-containing protein [Mucilaginibacter roseus]|uniref:DUF3592 domain-containing protein n=1 Tax=Mucilaginibacter roseus TaxID=1528868 RepID=A0ABS8TWN5_9SPHI|nr:DUF3592 domain-containing protein [Mucilaginibacter roseus]MCD8739236.1 DUF3592 domain-containing protein [Mucilaginibacter roseus]
MMEFLDANYQALLFILIGIVGLAYGLLKKRQKEYLLKNGIKTIGIVADHELGRMYGSISKTIYYPIIEFEDNEGKLRRLKSDFGYNFKVFEQNEQVEIYYDTIDFRKFIINHNNTKLFDYFPFIAGVLFFLAGIYSIII